MSSKRRREQAPQRPIAAAPEIDGTPIRYHWLAAFLVAAAVVAIYWQTWSHEFVSFDDRKYIYENPLVIGDGGLGAIWGDVHNDDPRTHYYPLTFTTFWIEHALVGLGPAPEDLPGSIGRPAHPLYHVTQAAFHAINAVLLLFLFRALGVAFVPAVVAVSLWALHPMCVESVAWVAERKNLVSVCFGLLCLLCYVAYRRRSLQPGAGKDPRRLALYGLSLVLFALALLAKSAVMTLAAVIVITDRLIDGRWTARSLARALPFLALAVAAISVVTAREAHITVATEPVDVVLRPFIAVAALVHYVLTVLAPVDQALIYPRWAESLALPRYWWSLALFLAALGASWRYRTWLGETWFWGMALFGLTVSPVLGFKHFAWIQFAFVSDHYLYLGGAGILLALVLMGDHGRRALAEQQTTPGGPVAVNAACAALVVFALVALSWRTVAQAATWRNNVTLYEHILKVSPKADIPLVNLGNHYYRNGDYETALSYYSEWARVSPGFVRAKLSSARSLARLGRHDEAVTYYEAALETAHERVGARRAARGEYARYLRQLGRREDALAQYRVLLDESPGKRTQLTPVIAALEAELDRGAEAQRGATVAPIQSPGEE
jgi:tetratricopeptide (TPR) repeat protein